jgi:hypothetical protein
MKALTCPNCKARVVVNGLTSMVCASCANAEVVVRSVMTVKFAGNNDAGHDRRAIAKALSARPAEGED